MTLIGWQCKQSTDRMSLGMMNCKYITVSWNHFWRPNSFMCFHEICTTSSFIEIRSMHVYSKNHEYLVKTQLHKNKTQCPSTTDLNKRFFPRPNNTTPWQLITHRSKISKNWNPPHWVPLYRFFKNWFLLVQKLLYSNYIQTHFTK